MTPTPRNNNDHLPPELRPIDAMLERLGAAERASMPAHLAGSLTDLAPIAGKLDALASADAAGAGEDLEDRVFEASIVELDGSLARLSLADRDAAPAALEDKLFVATRSIINGARAPTELDDDADVGAPIPMWRRRTVQVLTGLVSAAAGLAIVVTILGPGTVPDPVDPIPVAYEAFEEDLTEMFDMIDVSYVSSTALDDGISSSFELIDSHLSTGIGDFELFDDADTDLEGS